MYFSWGAFYTSIYNRVWMELLTPIVHKYQCAPIIFFMLVIFFFLHEIQTNPKCPILNITIHWKSRSTMIACPTKNIPYNSFYFSSSMHHTIVVFQILYLLLEYQISSYSLKDHMFKFWTMDESKYVKYDTR